MEELKKIEICELGLLKVNGINGSNIIDAGRECIELAKLLNITIDMYWNAEVVRVYKNTDIGDIIKQSIKK